MKRVLVINGPNLNLLGTREPEFYGSQSLEDIIKLTNSWAKSNEIELQWFQSNIEGEIIEEIQRVATDDTVDALLINPAGYTHTSVAIYDALRLVKKPIGETHLSQTHKREDFRATKLTSKAADLIIEGLGDKAYIGGLFALKIKYFED